MTYRHLQLTELIFRDSPSRPTCSRYHIYTRLQNKPIWFPSVARIGSISRGSRMEPIFLHTYGAEAVQPRFSPWVSPSETRSEPMSKYQVNPIWAPQICPYGSRMWPTLACLEGYYSTNYKQVAITIMTHL